MCKFFFFFRTVGTDNPAVCWKNWGHEQKGGSPSSLSSSHANWPNAFWGNVLARFGRRISATANFQRVNTTPLPAKHEAQCQMRVHTTLAPKRVLTDTNQYLCAEKNGKSFGTVCGNFTVVDPSAHEITIHDIVPA